MEGEMKRTVVLILAGALAGQMARAQAPGPVEQELMKLAQTALDATLKKDRAALERFYAEDYAYTHTNGVVLSKVQEIAQATSGESKWTSDVASDLNVRVFGDAAIVTGLEILKGTAKDYAPGPRRFSDLWVKRNGRWQQLGGQSTIVAPTTAPDPATALSAVKTLTAKTLTPKNADERAVLAAEQANVAADLANDDAKSRALQTSTFSFVSRAGVVASPSDPPGPQFKSVTIAYDSVQSLRTLAVVRGSLLWTDVKGVSPGVLRFTHVWVKQGDDWKLAAEQRTPIAGTRPMSN
jgi:ketosteroid isomerase-like protein